MAKTGKWLCGLLAVLGVAASTAALAAGASAHGVKTVSIRHQTRGCHAWGLTRGPAKASLRITAHADELIQVIDNDVMPHRLIQVAGPKVPIQTPNMHTMGARAQFSLAGKGVYRFKTRAGEDYAGMEMHTVGPDNVLRLTIVVR